VRHQPGVDYRDHHTRGAGGNIPGRWEVDAADLGGEFLEMPLVRIERIVWHQERTHDRVRLGIFDGGIGLQRFGESPGLFERHVARQPQNLSTSRHLTDMGQRHAGLGA
jgi:hypothetical protein